MNVKLILKEKKSQVLQERGAEGVVQAGRHELLEDADAAGTGALASEGLEQLCGAACRRNKKIKSVINFSNFCCFDLR